jgi:hypothetical protein
LQGAGATARVVVVHPYLSEPMMAARRRDLEAAMARSHRVAVLRADRPRRRRPPRVALGMGLIGLGLRLVDPGC